MKMTKRIVALVLAVAMMVTSLPTIASAANAVDVTLYGKDASYTFERTLGDGELSDLQSSNTNIVSVRERGKDLTHWYKDVIVTAQSIGTATVSWKNGRTKVSKTVEVKEAQVDRIEILNPIKDNEIILGKNDKHNFNIKVYAKNGQTFFNNKIEDTAVWTTSDAEVIKVDQTGKIEALKEGTATISVTVGGVKENVTLKVVTEGVKSVTITNKLETIVNTDKPDFNATVDAKGNISKEVTWSVSDEKVATIDENGVLTPLIGNASVTVTATSVADETKSDSFTLRINWDSNGGSSKYEHINVRVVDDAGNEIEGATVTMRLGQLIGSDKTFGPYYSGTDGKVTFNFDSYEWIWWIQAEKEGYITQKDTYSEPGLFGYIYYIGLLASSNENLTIKMHKINTYDVTYKYENEIFETDTLYEGETVDTAMIASATSKAEAYAERLTRESNEYTYAFAGFDKDLTDVEITEDTVVTAQYNTTLKGNKVVSFWQQNDKKDKAVVVEYKQEPTQLSKEWLKDKTDDQIIEALANFVGNKVVAKVEQTDNEVKVIYGTNKYQFVYVEDGVDDRKLNNADSKIKVTRQYYYVIDVENTNDYTKEMEREDNAKALIDEYNLDDSIRIQDSEESWIYKTYEWIATHLYDTTTENYSRFNLWFTRRIENPIDIEHRIYFNNVAMSDDQGAKVYPTETIIVEEAGKTVEQEKIDHSNKDAVKAAYIKYALPTCHVDENYLGVESVKYVPTDKGAKIVITYWAKRINVQYEGFDAEGKSVGQIKDEWHKIVNYMDYDHAEMSKYLNVLDENNKPQTISFNGVQYRLNADKSTAEGKHSCTGTTGKKDDFNVVTITLAYDFDVQANCKHEQETKYEDKGTTHDFVTYCPLCEYEFSRETGLDHRYSMKHEEGLKCIDCGHDRTFEATIEATPRSVASFDEATIARMIAEAKEEFVTKTNEYFESIAQQGEDFAPVDAEDLEELVMEEVTSTDTTKRFEGCILVNDKLIKYVLNISLMSGGNGGGSNGGSGSNGTRIGDGPVAQGSELLNDLRLNRPNDLITRAEFVGVLANIFQVPEDRIYDKAWNLEECTQREQIERLATYYIVKGYSDEEFGQNDSITLEQMYTIISRALLFQQKVELMTDEEVKATLETSSYAMKVSDWAERGVSIAMKAGIAAAAETAPTEPQNGVMRITAADTLQKYIEVVAAPTEEVKVAEEK